MTPYKSCLGTVWYKWTVWRDVQYCENSSLLGYDVEAKEKSWLDCKSEGAMIMYWEQLAQW